MSSLSLLRESRETAAERSLTCRVPNCWRDAKAVSITGKTEIEAVLCERHRRDYLGVSS